MSIREKLFGPCRGCVALIEAMHELTAARDKMRADTASREAAFFSEIRNLTSKLTALADAKAQRSVDLVREPREPRAVDDGLLDPITANGLSGGGHINIAEIRQKVRTRLETAARVELTKAAETAS